MALTFVLATPGLYTIRMPGLEAAWWAWIHHGQAPATFTAAHPFFAPAPVPDPLFHSPAPAPAFPPDAPVFAAPSAGPEPAPASAPATTADADSSANTFAAPVPTPFLAAPAFLSGALAADAAVAATSVTAPTVIIPATSPVVFGSLPPSTAETAPPAGALRTPPESPVRPVAAPASARPSSLWDEEVPIKPLTPAPRRSRAHVSRWDDSPPPLPSSSATYDGSPLSAFGGAHATPLPDGVVEPLAL
ncbi:hypothetical protein FA95DRAFT_1612456 [Auriscalpium vulgare]|uniref:Uncharacterized protein n=1 Tax=Auriscalpium vulgare TaxID=40419 RepID=A0ACB8R694_9AGAM|nr:hypothetical protein FA95DRAFT_1612456 [Auriscalpium vulgare]